MAKRHFLQQAHKFDPKKLNTGSWYVSEKLDGQRCFWDGGITNGLPVEEVPWANHAKDKKIRVATGLWSRYGKPIHAPQAWLSKLPPFPLDGELWMGRGLFQTTRSIVSKHEPNENDWAGVKYVIFDSPSLEQVFKDSIIDLPNYYKRYKGICEWLLEKSITINHNTDKPFKDVYYWLQENLIQNSVLSLLEQIRLPYDGQRALEVLKHLMHGVLEHNGEGLVLRAAASKWIPERAHHLLKCKPVCDDEANVIGYVAGRETDKGSKLLGLMGALIVEWRGKRFELSGFTDSERQLANTPGHPVSIDATSYSILNPGVELPPCYEAKHFPRGSKVTFIYRELTNSGIPKEARYFRKRGDE